MNKEEAQLWRRAISWLRRFFPPQRRIAVHTRRICAGIIGRTYLSSGTFKVHISPEPFQVKIDTLIHEWAHVLTWFGAEQEEVHGNEWGICYAKIYRAFVEWNYGEE